MEAMDILDYQDSATRAKKLLQVFGPASSAWGELRSSLSFPLHTPQPQPTPSLPPMHTGSLVSLVTPSSPATQARQSMSHLHVGGRLIGWCTQLIKPNPTRLPTLPDPTQPNCHQERALERYYRLWSRRRGSSRAPSGTHSTTRCVA